MKRIVAPIRFGERGEAVANLQEALLFIVRTKPLRPDDRDADQWQVALADEMREQAFRERTLRLLNGVQNPLNLPRTEVIDDGQAERLNRELEALGAFTQQSSAPERLRAVSGRVTRSDQQPFNGSVRAFHIDGRNATIRLGDTNTDTDGDYTIRYEPLPDRNAINLQVSVVDETGRTIQSSDLIREAKAIEVVDLVVPLVQPTRGTRLVEGRVLFEHGAPAEGLTLRLYRLGFGGAEGATRLAETETRPHGLYSLLYAIEGQAANLEVRTVDAAGNEVSLSKIIKNASEREVLNLIAPAQAQPLAAEFTRLTSDLQPHVSDLMRLRTTRENAEQQDLTLLHEATGWDARLIATAAMATRLSANEETGLPQDALYGLLRVGLPSDKFQLARVSSEAFTQALDKTRAAGIVDLTNEQVVQVKQSFDTFSVNTRLAVQAPGSRATYGDLLQKLELNENDQQALPNST